MTQQKKKVPKKVRDALNRILDHMDEQFWQEEDPFYKDIDNVGEWLDNN